MATELIGFIGAGQMARALASGFVNAGEVDSTQICASDPAAAACEAFLGLVPGAAMRASSPEIVAACGVVFLAVKPQLIDVVCEELKAADTSSSLFVSIAAGVTLGKLSAGLRTERVIRVMPNTPCLVGEGAAGFCAGGGVSSEDHALVERLLNAVGLAVAVPESLMDTITGLSGSGPAFVFQMIEAMSDGGVRMGLPRDVATRLATQTVLGAAKMARDTGEHPGVLKDRVTSPGGTTIARIHALESGGFRAAMMDAVQAATRRSKELG